MRATLAFNSSVKLGYLGNYQFQFSRQTAASKCLKARLRKKYFQKNQDLVTEVLK